VAVYTNLYLEESCTDTVSVSTAAACFPGYETVALADGTVKSLKDVQIGDKILAARKRQSETAEEVFDYVYSDVIAVPHKQDEQSFKVAEFVALVVASISGNSEDILRLTPPHLIWASCSDEAYKLIKAADVFDGCFIRRVQLDGSLPSRTRLTDDSVHVIQALRVKSPGLYSVVVADADFVSINGVVVSPFAVNHAVPNAYYNIFRALYATLPASLYKGIFDPQVPAVSKEASMIALLGRLCLRAGEHLSELLVAVLSL
jgi:hypothetical protein